MLINHGIVAVNVTAVISPTHGTFHPNRQQRKIAGSAATSRLPGLISQTPVSGPRGLIAGGMGCSRQRWAETVQDNARLRICL